MPGFPVHHQLPVFAQTNTHRVSDGIQPSHPLSSPSPLAFNLSRHQSLFQESVLHIRWPKCWSFNFSISPSNEYSGLISFGWTGWTSLQSKGLSRVFSKSSKASTLLHSALFIVQLSHSYMTTEYWVTLWGISPPCGSVWLLRDSNNFILLLCHLKPWLSPKGRVSQ